MTHTDQGFPYLRYEPGRSHREWGRSHGEQFRTGIRELASIRRELMREMNPKLSGGVVTDLAREQWEATRRFSPDLHDELHGIAEGSGMRAEDITILNNYTDFRDIDPEDSRPPSDDQGCSTTYVNNGREILAGQTWDMHGSAKNYVSVLHVPATNGAPEAVLFSLVGCVGMMGYTTRLTSIGVNNLNTVKARAGIIWPVLVRETLRRGTETEMRQVLMSAEVTSGHNYLLASPEIGEMWEISPTVRKTASSLSNTEGFLFHTNHCLTAEGRAVEKETSLNSTTHVRFGLLERKMTADLSFDGMYDVLTDHDGYPKSICSHFQSSAKDPSFTCGGAIGELREGKLLFWRGCPDYDANFVAHEFEFSGGSFRKVSE